MSKLSRRQKNHISKQIKAYRKQKYGYIGGNRDLAEELGISPQILSLWITNKRTPSATHLQALAALMRISLDELCNTPRINFPSSASERSMHKASISTQNTPNFPRDSMLEISSINEMLWNKQSQMLQGKITPKAHAKWLERISKCVSKI